LAHETENHYIPDYHPNMEFVYDESMGPYHLVWEYPDVYASELDYWKARRHYVNDTEINMWDVPEENQIDMDVDTAWDNTKQLLGSAASKVYGTFWLGGAVGFTAFLGHLGAALLTLTNGMETDVDLIHSPAHEANTTLWTARGHGHRVHADKITSWGRLFGKQVTVTRWHNPKAEAVLEGPKWRSLL
jgi:hypothetical protein